jgi:WD40 repeat protein
MNLLPSKLFFVLGLLIFVGCRTVPVGTESFQNNGAVETTPAGDYSKLLQTPPSSLSSREENHATVPTGLDGQTTPPPSKSPQASNAPTRAVTAIITPSKLVAATPVISPTQITFTQPISPTEVLSTTWAYTTLQVIPSKPINHLAWGQGRENFAAATDLGLFVIDAATLETEHIFNLGEKVTSVIYSPNPSLLVSGGLNGDILWRDASSGSHLATFDAHRLGVSALAISRRGEFLISGSDDGMLRLWVTGNVMNQALTEYPILQEWTIGDRVTCVDYADALQTVAVGSFRTVFVFDSGTGGRRQKLNIPAGWVSAVQLPPDGSQLAVAADDNILRIWNVSTWEEKPSLVVTPVDRLTALDFDFRGTYLALGGNNGKVVVWNRITNVLVIPQDQLGAPVTALTFSPDNTQLLVGYANGIVRVWDFEE